MRASQASFVAIAVLVVIFALVGMQATVAQNASARVRRATNGEIGIREVDGQNRMDFANRRAQQQGTLAIEEQVEVRQVPRAFVVEAQLAIAEVI